MDNKAMWDKANSLRGCLANLKVATSRRRYVFSPDDGFLDMSPFIRDIAALLASKHLRILDDRTQVFTDPHSAFVRTRMAHTHEVMALAAMMADILGLNTNLAEAAALGHDIGHVPCGHQGEAWLAKAMNRPEFNHAPMGVVIAQNITRKGKGLNLTWNTLHAMAAHSGNDFGYEVSEEARVVFWADKIAYVFGDINDIGGRMRYPLGKEINGILESFGSTYREWIATIISSLVIESAERKHVYLERSEVAVKFNRLRRLMRGIYLRVTEQDVNSLMAPVLEFLQRIEVGDPFLLLSLMTDKDVIDLAETQMRSIDSFNRTSVGEIAPMLRDLGTVDLCDPTLNW